MKPTLKAPGTKRLKLRYDHLLSIFAFNFNVRRYTTACREDAAAANAERAQVRAASAAVASRAAAATEALADGRITLVTPSCIEFRASRASRTNSPAGPSGVPRVSTPEGREARAARRAALNY
jgi:hypothetical protein